MTMIISHATQAEDPKRGITLDELGRFVQLCHTLEMAGDTRILVTVGWSRQVRRIEAVDDSQTLEDHLR